jgi:hypothetical protein
MENHEIYFKRSINRFQIPIEDQYLMFLSRYSSELKFMDPWAQDDIHLPNTPGNVNRVSGIEQINLNKVTNKFENEI